MEFVSTGKSIGEFLIYTPVFEPLTIIYSSHYIINSAIIETLKDYYIEKGQNVLYFQRQRIFTLSQDEIEAIRIAEKLTEDYQTEKFFKTIDLQVNPWDYENLKGQEITSGYQHLIHVVYKVFSLPKPSIVMIDSFETGLHANLIVPFLWKLKEVNSVKRLIVTTRDGVLRTIPGFHEHTDFMKERKRIFFDQL